MLESGLIKISNEVKAGRLFAIADQGFSQYCKERRRSAVWDGIDNDIVNDVYSYLAQRFEALEHLGLMVGNGHHLAQRFSMEIQQELKERWRGD